MKKCLILLISLLLAANSFPSSKISIVLDDFGYGGYPARKILMMKYPFALAILPFAPNAVTFSQDAIKAGFETILHLPLEPLDCTRSNNSYLRVAMSGKEIQQSVVDYLLRIPGIVGVNNHQGSYFTENEQSMQALLQALYKYNLFFLDSLTTSLSVSQKVATDLNVTILRRDIFLDNITTEEYIGTQLVRLCDKALKHGYSIGIGHARSKTINALEKLLPQVLYAYPEVHLVRLSELYKEECKHKKNSPCKTQGK